MRVQVLVLAGALVAAAPPLRSQQSQQTPATRQEQAPTPLFRAGVNLLELDVSVFDKERRPVRGLTANDFTVLEDGRPKAVVAFSAVELPGPPIATAAWLQTAPADVDANDVDDRRLVVILVDDAEASAQKPVDLGKVENTRLVATRAIGELGPMDLAAVVFTADGGSGQSFTQDRQRLRQAVERTGLGNQTDNCRGALSAARTLQTVVHSLAAVEHRRKLIIDISVGAPFDITAPANLSDPFCKDPVAAATLDAIRVAQEADINVYAVDPSGLKNSGLNDLQMKYLEAVAANTGGRAIVRTNAAADQVPGIFVENNTYYLLGYQSQNTTDRESLKRVEVKVNRPEVEVRTRTTYAAPHATRAAPAAAAVADAAIEDIVPKTNVSLKATAAAFADASGRGAVAVIVVSVGAPTGVAAFTDTIVLAVRAFTPDGRLQGDAHQVTSVNLMPSEGNGTARAEVFLRLALKPGRYSLRIAASSKMAAKDGSVYTDVVVPDFAKEDVSLSGLVLAATPGLRAAPRELLTALLPVLPTAERSFERTQQVMAFIRAYQGGTGPLRAGGIRVRVMDDHGAVVLDRTTTIPAAAFAMSRSADYQSALPLRDWHPGAYLLTVSTTVGNHFAAREVRIDVR